MNQLASRRPISGVAVLDPFPAMGHVRAFLVVAEWLREIGFTPVFLVSIDFAGLIEKNGFEAYVVLPVLFRSDSQEIKEKGAIEVFLDSISGNRLKKQKEELWKQRTAYKKIVDEISPRFVLLDDHYSAKALFYQDLGLPTILVSTMTLPLHQKFLPPFQSTYIPSSSVLYGVKAYLAWCSVRLIRWKSRTITRLVCGGADQLRVLSTSFGTTEEVFDWNRCFGVGMKGLPILVTYPKTFGFREIEPPDHCYFLGKLPESRSSVEPLSNRLAAVVEQAKRKGMDIVYCSLGTVTFDEIPVCVRFFRRIFQVAASLPHAFFIVNIGKNVDVSLLKANQSNVAVFDSLPQQVLLTHVQLMINHGGINSIKECIAAEVPMLVYPLSLKWDQPGCGARVAYHKLGLRGNIRSDGVGSITKKVSKVLTDREYYVYRLREIKSEMDIVNCMEEKRLLDLLSTYSFNISIQPKMPSREAIQY
ncbi:putative glycosyl transferase from UDP-glucuronosyltransferase family [Lunatimonas lonarensis]|uniref:Putative glycosyl transferase from UDP-glucuronosyltransferase family n=1 Tax=Lunatimonas lonarensis TaxID=1232681 RepID=R7ZKS6_9BACT|nr:glycosyltransferase [Lunatimonas lonarensis]EON74698.1 putative glycosyl transferase from UDP-glucuronosyltransferase family [Lunatimonas lonarensis]